jgi:hypothetical protein
MLKYWAMKKVNTEESALKKPNFAAAKWLALLLRIRVGLSEREFGPDTSYPGKGFRSFPQYLHANAGTVSQIRPRPFHSTSFQIH